MRGWRALIVNVVLSLFVFILTAYFNTCAQDCSTNFFGGPGPDTAGGCALKAYGMSAKVVKAQASTPPNFLFWVRFAGGGTGRIFSTGDPPLLRLGFNGGGFNTQLAGASDPNLGCPSLSGSKVCGPFFGTDGEMLTYTPGVNTRITLFTGTSNVGPSFTLTLHASDTAIIDTAMLGRSICDIRPSTEKGEPINISSGNVYRNEVDAVINTGQIGPFTFERNYNSFSTSLPTLGSHFGYGWQHNFQITFASNVLTEGTGRRIPFYTISIGPGFTATYIGPPAVTDTIFRVGGDAIQYYEIRKRNGTRIFLNEIGQDSLIKDRNGNQILLHGTPVRLDSISAPGGRKFKLTTTTGSRITELRNQAGTLLATYAYHAAPDTNYLKRVTYGNGSWVEYSYDSVSTPYKLKKILTSDSNGYFYEYDTKSRAKASYRTANADRIDVTYTLGVGNSGSIDTLYAVVTDSLGNRDTLMTIPNTLATDRLLMKGRNAGCTACADQYTYDSHSNLTRKISPLGVVDSMAYDTLGRDLLWKRIEARGTTLARTHTFGYTSFDLLAFDSTKSIVNTDSFLVRNFLYDGQGNDTLAIETGLLTATIRYADTTRFKYNSSGQVLVIDGPRRNVKDSTRFTYNATTGDLDSVIEYTGTDSLKTAYTSYDVFGNPLTVIGPNSDETNYRYDARQRVDRIIRKKGSTADTTLYTYNFAGDIKQITLPRGTTIKYGYDLAGRLTSIVNGAGDSILYTYDLMSNRKSERIRRADTLYKTTYYDYDSRSRLIQICIGDSTDAAKFDCTSFGYDDIGNRIAQLSAKGDSTHFRYDALNRLDRVIQKHDNGYDTTVLFSLNIKVYS